MPPKVAVDTMPAGKFFAYAAEILKLHPAHITDQPILAQMQRIRIERGCLRFAHAVLFAGLVRGCAPRTLIVSGGLAAADYR
jgi:hypothetical protein